MNLLEFIVQNAYEILALTREHVFLVSVSAAAAVLIGVPLGILLTRKKSLQTPVLGFANVMQTVPSLALFGLLIPISFIGIGSTPAIIALALYAFLPVIRNTVTGISGIDEKITESATAMGMTDWQILKQVELPLAMPVILTGIRIAVVISVGVATIAAAVGAGGLGTYIFRGLRQNDNNLILTGAIFSALLALLADFGLGQIARLYQTGGSKVSGSLQRIIASASIAVIATLIAFSLIPAFSSGISPGLDGQVIRIGSKDFTESVILAEILAQTLEKKGVTVERKYELGGNLAHDGLLSDQIDVYPEYTGTAYTAILKNQPITEANEVYRETKSQYDKKFELVLSPPVGFANDFAILVRGEVARKNGLKTISDAVPLGAEWQAGFGQDFMSRADGYSGFRNAYGFEFRKQPREMDLALTYRALASGELDIIAGNSTDGLISALDLFQLEDDKKYFPPYQAVFIVRKKVLQESTLLKIVLSELENAISTEEMRALNYEVDGLKRQPKDVAISWVNSRIAGR